MGQLIQFPNQNRSSNAAPSHLKSYQPSRRVMMRTQSRIDDAMATMRECDQFRDFLDKYWILFLILTTALGFFLAMSIRMGAMLDTYIGVSTTLYVLDGLAYGIIGGGFGFFAGMYLNGIAHEIAARRRDHAVDVKVGAEDSFKRHTGHYPSSYDQYERSLLSQKVQGDKEIARQRLAAAKQQRPKAR